MLLFILDASEKEYNQKIFQYISCYCLSTAITDRFGCFIISIHLMLLFI